jgi:hypothetical protein
MLGGRRRMVGSSKRTGTMNTKTIFKSKTFWIQALAVAAAFIPQVRAWVAANPVEFAAALAAVNVLVRFATSGKVNVFGKQDDGWDDFFGSGTGDGKPAATGDVRDKPTAAPFAFMALLVVGAAAVLPLASCSTVTTTKDGTITARQFNPPPEVWAVIGRTIADTIDRRSGK